MTFETMAAKHGIAAAGLAEGKTDAHREINQALSAIKPEIRRALKSNISGADLQDLLKHHAAGMSAEWRVNALKEQVARYAELSKLKLEYGKANPPADLAEMERIKAEIGSKTDQELMKEASKYVGQIEPNGYVDPFRLELIAARLRVSKEHDADASLAMLKMSMDNKNYRAQHLNTSKGKALLAELPQFDLSNGNFGVMMQNQTGGQAAAFFSFSELMDNLVDSVRKDIAATPVSSRYKD